METRQLGNSDLHITPVGLGAWAIGGGNWDHGWGPQDDSESIDTIHKAIDAGMNWIDTAAIYGLGRSERVVGEALKGMSEKPYIFTKCSLVWDE
ncbi:MAG: aldo/keto reductase, partial [Chloroflexota bacterium]